MESLTAIINLFLHIDQHLASFTAAHGSWVYGLLFVIIFIETGLVIMPFLPGDSLLFAAGTLTAHSLGTLNINSLFILLAMASVLGNGVNYLIGRKIGPQIFSSPNSRLFNPNHLLKAHAFYEQYGAKTLIIARFLPILRTFAPFVAGIGYMSYRSFFVYNLLSALLWVGSVLYISFWFGNLPLIQHHFSTVILIIIGLSLLPFLITLLRKTRAKPQLS